MKKRMLNYLPSDCAKEDVYAWELLAAAMADEKNPIPKVPGP